jgi:hypothetical protein
MEVDDKDDKDQNHNTRVEALGKSVYEGAGSSVDS